LARWQCIYLRIVRPAHPSRWCRSRPFRIATARIAMWRTILLILRALGALRASRHGLIPPIAPCHFARRYPYFTTYSLLLCCSFYALWSASRLASGANLPYRSLSFCAMLPSFLLIHRSLMFIPLTSQFFALGTPQFQRLFSGHVAAPSARTRSPRLRHLYARPPVLFKTAPLSTAPVALDHTFVTSFAA
jgi:hypothetical protein